MVGAVAANGPWQEQPCGVLTIDTTAALNNEHDISKGAAAVETRHHAPEQAGASVVVSPHRESPLPAAPLGVLVSLAVSGGVTKSCPAAVPFATLRRDKVAAKQPVPAGDSGERTGASLGADRGLESLCDYRQNVVHVLLAFDGRLPGVVNVQEEAFAYTRVVHGAV